MTCKPIRVALATLLAALCVPAMSAKTGAPHTIKVSSNLDDVTLSWEAPHAAKDLKWHDGNNYNGFDGSSNNLQGTVKFYTAAQFDEKDLAHYVGDKVEAITFYQYRPVVSATVIVFENGVKVAEKKADPKAFVKDTELRVALDEAVTIKANAEYRFAVLWEAGANLDFVAITDKAVDAPGKGDLASYDGKKWFAAGVGDFMITANLANDVDEEAVSFDVYRNGTKVNAQAIADNTVTLSGEPEGTHKYTVAAVYANGNVHHSGEVSASPVALASVLPGVTFNKSTVSDLNVGLSWMAPLKGGNELSWGDKVNALNIGGTAASNTKVWIKNEFTSSDLVAFAGGKIAAINSYYAEKCVSAVTVWVMCDGKIVAYKAASADEIASITEGSWLKVALDEPVTIEPGHAYTYGTYVLHTPKMHPIGVGSSATVDVKGNSFSTSSPNSSDFLKSNPSWKTLRSGGMEGNWMLTADIEGAPAPIEGITYDLYRNGEKIANGLNVTSYDDVVADLGTYTYSIVATVGSRKSDAIKQNVTVKLPAAYTAPVLESATFDPETRTVEAIWNTDKELKKYDEAAYIVGFDEEMTMMWGVQYTADELAAYAGMSINKLKFAVGDDVKNLKVGVYTKNGQALSEMAIPDGAIEALGFYTIPLDSPVVIGADQDLIFAYSATCPAGTSPIIIDGGPLVDGGARISLTGGATWMNLGTVNPAYNNYNVVISAMAGDTVCPDSAPAQKLSSADSVAQAVVIGRNAKVETKELGVQGVDVPKARVAAERPQVASFNVYRNGEVIANTTDYSFSEKLTSYNRYEYYITTVFSNGWESAPSTGFAVTNRIDQKTVAPYGLKGEVANNDLKLSWQSPANSTSLSYITNPEKVLGLGMTGTNPTSYAVVRFSEDDLKDHVGKVVDHIQFGLYDAGVTTLSVIVMNGENVVYQQAVPVSSLIVGLNDVRLNEPVVIPAGCEFGVGYVTKYPTGLKPLGMDEAPAVSGYGDLISSSGSAGYWYSLLTKFKMNYNWFIRAILAEGNQELKTKAAAAGTYNVYRDGTLVAEGVNAESYTVSSAADGRYTVTAVNADGSESGESNAVLFNVQAAVSDIAVEGVDNSAPVEYFNLNGQRIDTPAPGTPAIRRQGNTATKLIK